MVDKDRIQGSAERAKGKVKEVIGKVTGDSKLEGDGQADQLKGQVIPHRPAMQLFDTAMRVDRLTQSG